MNTKVTVVPGEEALMKWSRFSLSPVAPSLALLAAVALLLGGCEKAPPMAFPPPDVSVARVIQKDVPISGDWVATLDGYTNAQIQPQVAGYLVKQNYREGSQVHKGDVLFQIDPRPFQAVLDQAKGQLAQANAQLGLATLNVNRDTPVAKLHAIAQSQLDTDIQAKLSAEAGVQAAQASVEQAELNMGFTEVRSLIDGIAGIAQTQIGNLVSPTTVLTTVSQVNPIKVYFPISEQEYMRIAGKIPGSVDLLASNNTVPLTLVLSNGSEYSQKGTIIFADRQVDSQTGTIRIVGSFANPGNILRPGQFGRIRAVTENLHNALLVPQRAVTELQGSYQVAVVGADNKVNIRTIKVGDRVGSLWVVREGLKADERVITEGVMKVGEGAPVKPSEEAAPPPQATAATGGTN
jgi:membrane fusion protein (multidrug efflux system)